MTRDQSIRSASRSFASSTSCSRSQTPAACQSRRRRQQLMPLPQPISRGSRSQRRPVCRMNRMPVSTARSSSGLRPGYRERRGLGGGNNGSRLCKNANRCGSTSSYLRSRPLAAVLARCMVGGPSGWSECEDSSTSSRSVPVRRRRTRLDVRPLLRLSSFASLPQCLRSP